MTEMLEFVVHYGYALLFVWVLLEQAGCRFRPYRCCWLPEPSPGQGRMHLALAMLIPAVGFAVQRYLLVLLWQAARRCRAEPALSHRART